MTGNNPNQNSIKVEFQALWDNLKNRVTAAWESGTRKQAQEDVAVGLDEINGIEMNWFGKGCYSAV